MTNSLRLAAVLSVLVLGLSGLAQARQADVFDRVTHGYAVSEGGVRIHYASLGQGPLVVMIHGFPDFWYSWRHQMAALSKQFQVVAIDQRALHSDGLPGTWKWLEKDLTLVTVPGAGQFVQQDAAELVTSTTQWWLAMRTPK